MKVIVQILKRLTIGVLGIAVFLTLIVWIVPNPNLQAQQLPEFIQPNGIEFQYADFDQEAIDSLDLIYGKNKEIPEEIKLPVLLALSFYPDFAHTKIEFRLERELFPYSSRPNISSFLGGERKYAVRVANKVVGPISALQYEHVPLNALVGVLAHELAHVWYYETQSRAQLWNIAINYLSPSFSRQWENLTDRIAIHKGAGTQILAWAKYTSEVFDSDQTAKENERYMSVGSIQNYLENFR